MCDMLVEDLKPSLTNEYDLLVIPGGVKALEKLRLEEKAVEFTSQWMSEDKMTFAICNGPQLLITAQCLNGRECAAYYSIEQDVKNAGATYNRHVCIDRNLISCSHYDFMGEWIKLGMESFTSHESCRNGSP